MDHTSFLSCEILSFSPSPWSSNSWPQCFANPNELILKFLFQVLLHRPTFVLKNARKSFLWQVSAECRQSLLLWHSTDRCRLRSNSGEGDFESANLEIKSLESRQKFENKVFPRTDFPLDQSPQTFNACSLSVRPVLAETRMPSVAFGHRETGLGGTLTGDSERHRGRYSIQRFYRTGLNNSTVHRGGAVRPPARGPW